MFDGVVLKYMGCVVNHRKAEVEVRFNCSRIYGLGRGSSSVARYRAAPRCRSTAGASTVDGRGTKPTRNGKGCQVLQKAQSVELTVRDSSSSALTAG